MKRISVNELNNNLDYYLEQSNKEDIIVYDENEEEICCFINPRELGKKE